MTPQTSPLSDAEAREIAERVVNEWARNYPAELSHWTEPPNTFLGQLRWAALVQAGAAAVPRGEPLTESEVADLERVIRLQHYAYLDDSRADTKFHADAAREIAAIVAARVGGGDGEGHGRCSFCDSKWNTRRTDDGVEVCFNEHEKGDDCEYERFVPIARAESAERALDEALRIREDAQSALKREGAREALTRFADAQDDGSMAGRHAASRAYAYRDRVYRPERRSGADRRGA